MRSVARVDYVPALGAHDMQPVDLITGDVMLAVAARFDKARLIDNVVVSFRNDNAQLRTPAGA